TITVTAVTGKDSRGKNIISAFIVPTNLKGLTITSDYDKMGVRGSDTTQIVLEDVVVPKDALLGDSEAGFKQLLTTLDGGRISIAALGVGIAQASLDRALAYAKERTQFGTSISKYQTIQIIVADMAIEVEITRNII